MKLLKAVPIDSSYFLLWFLFLPLRKVFQSGDRVNKSQPCLQEKEDGEEF